jgi:hypothetical protein
VSWGGGGGSSWPLGPTWKLFLAQGKKKVGPPCSEGQCDEGRYNVTLVCATRKIFWTRKGCPSWICWIALKIFVKSRICNSVLKKHRWLLLTVKSTSNQQRFLILCRVSSRILSQLKTVFYYLYSQIKYALHIHFGAIPIASKRR